MSRISINEMTTFHWSFEEDVTNYQSAGIGGIGVWRRKLEDYGEERGIELLRETGLSVTSVSCAGGFTGSDGHTFDEAVEDAMEALRLAAQMHAGCLVVVTGSRSGHTLNHAGRLACDALRRLGDLGATLGVQIALAPRRRPSCDRWTFLPNLSAALQLLERCEHPQVGVVLDLWQFCGDSAAGPSIVQLAPWVKIAALYEPERAAAALDPSPTDESARQRMLNAVRGLEEAGFEGPYEAQILCEKSWKSDYAQLVADCRARLESVCPPRPSVEVSCPPAFAAGPTSSETATPHRAVEPVPPI